MGYQDAIGNWKSKGGVQFDKIIKYIDTHHKEINIHWLITGEGLRLVNDFQVSSEEEDRYARAGRLLYEAITTLLPAPENDIRSTVEKILQTPSYCAGPAPEMTEEEYARFVKLRRGIDHDRKLTDEQD